MDEKLRADFSGNKVIYWLVPLILTIWASAYLYFISSSQVPLNLSDYDESLHVKEHILHRTLTSTNMQKADKTELEELYESLSQNEICLQDLPAAEKHLLAAIKLTEPPLFTNQENMAKFCLQNANLCRDLNKFDQAKINYNCSLECLHQITLIPDFNEVALKTAAINFNNLGILNFLAGQEAINLKQRLKNYLIARDYFARAKDLMFILGTNKNRCFQQTINENLNRCLVEMQFSS